MGIFDSVSNFFKPRQQPVTPQALAWKAKAPVAYTPAAPYMPAPVVVQPKPVATKPKARPASKPVASKPKAQVKAKAPIRRARVAAKKVQPLVEESAAPVMSIADLNELSLSDDEFTAMAESGMFTNMGEEAGSIQPATMPPVQQAAPMQMPANDTAPWSKMDYPWQHNQHPDNNGGWGPIDVSDKARQNPEFQKLFAALSDSNQTNNIYTYAKERLGSIPREDPRMQAIYAHYLANSGNTN